MPKLYLYGGIALAVLLVALLIYREGKDTGGTQVEQKHERANNAARKRKDAVQPSDAASTADSLRAGTF